MAAVEIKGGVCWFCLTSAVEKEVIDAFMRCPRCGAYYYRENVPCYRCGYDGS